jgi:hypothetical protein
MKQFSQGNLALIMVVALGLIWLLQPTFSGWLGETKTTPAAPQIESNPNRTESKSNASPKASAPTPGVDPFKAHIEKNGLSPVPLANPSASTPSSSTGVKPVGADPFKAFLEQQKQQNKDAGISPFGK